MARLGHGCEYPESTGFDPKLKVYARTEPLGFDYGVGVFGPEPDLRRLDSIRGSLRDPRAEGPDPVYAVAMDVGERLHFDRLASRMLLFGVVTYAAGSLGEEPVRSQGHVHRVSKHSNWSPPEIYEIWAGRAVILMQEATADDPGRCYAVQAEPGDKIVVPPGWAHAAISADPTRPLTFGALCDREYGFEYDPIRARQGLAWYPLLDGNGELEWEPNPAYRLRMLEVKRPAPYEQFGLDSQKALYEQLVFNFDSFSWVSQPHSVEKKWVHFIP